MPVTFYNYFVQVIATHTYWCSSRAHMEEFDAMIFELEYKMVDKNIALGSRMYELMSKRIEQLKRKVVEVEGDQKEVRRKANEMVY